MVKPADEKLRRQVITTIQDLLHIAQLTMPDTYFLTDTRVRRAQRLLAKLKEKPTKSLARPTRSLASSSSAEPKETK